MRVLVVVAGAIAAALHEEAVIAHQLGALGRDVALALLRHGARDVALAGLEVVVQALSLVALAPVAELWVGAGLARAVDDVVGEDQVAVEVHTHEARVHPLVLVVYAALAEEVGEALPEQHHRVLRLVGDDVVEGLLATAATLGGQAVGTCSAIQRGRASRL